MRDGHLIRVETLNTVLAAGTPARRGVQDHRKRIYHEIPAKQSRTPAVRPQKGVREAEKASGLAKTTRNEKPKCITVVLRMIHVMAPILRLGTSVTRATQIPHMLHMPALLCIDFRHSSHLSPINNPQHNQEFRTISLNPQNSTVAHPIILSTHQLANHFQDHLSVADQLHEEVEVTLQTCRGLLEMVPKEVI